MNGQLSEQPVAELVREISLKSLSGRLRLEHDRVKVVAYFNHGQFLYAASNLKTLRIREYLKKGDQVSDKDLAQFNERVSDIDVVKVLLAQKLLPPATAEELQTRQVADVLRLTLLWTEGSWEFDSRSRLDEQLNLKINVDALVLEAARRLPAKFAATRFRNAAETISPLAEPLLHDNLLPTEGYMLSRLDRPMTVRELTAISGLGEDETLALVYSLAIAGLVKREHWNSVFRGDQKTQPSREEPRRKEPKRVAPTERERKPSREADAEEVEAFLARVRNAQTHYDVLGAGSEASAADLKAVYYQLARRYHPDRFRKADPVLVTRIESAFARITQAYDTLRDDGLRASYNAKLQARRKVEQLADTAPKPTTPSPQPESIAENPEAVISVAERAETHFKEGFAQLEMGQLKAALSLFAAAARAVPSEPRYRAYYGQMLAGNENTRRAAEAELNAAVRLDPENSEYRVMLAELYRDLGLKLRAKGEAGRAVAADPNNRKARELLRALK